MTHADTQMRPRTRSRGRSHARSRTRRRGRFLRRFLSVLGSVALGAAALVLIGAFLLSVFGIARFVPVLSNSMAPEMPKGSLAIAVPLARQDVVAGDVVIFTAPVGPDRRVIHRVTDVLDGDEATSIVDWSADKLYMETKGDNNPAADSWIVTISDDFLWSKSMVVPYMGWPTIWLGDPKTRFIAFGLAGLGVVGWALVVVWRRSPEDPGE